MFNMKSMTGKSMAVMAVVAFLCLGAFGVMAADEAQADPEVYTVEYRVGSMTYTDTTDVAAYTLKSLSAIGAAVPAGKEFVGWVAEGSTTVYVAGSIVTLTAATTTYIAEVSDIEYTVKFVEVDGETVISTDSGIYGEAVIVPEAPAIEGFISAGWTDGVKTYKSNEIPAFSANVTYRAVYTIDYDILFVVDGITVLQTTVSEFNGVATPAKDGYVFVAWYDGLIPVKVAELAGYIAEVEEDTTFLAGWEADRLSVIFMAGDDVVTTETVLYGDLAVEPKVPKGYDSWDWDFKTPITSDTTINAIKAPAPAPSGLKDPIVLSAVLIVAFVAVLIVAFVVFKMRKGELKIRRKSKNGEGEA